MSESLVVLCNVLNSLPESVIVVNRECKIMDANQAARMTHGVDFHEELPVIDFPQLKEAILKALSGEYCFVEYKTTNKKTGKEVWLRARCNPVYTSGEIPSGVSIFEKDITCQKEMIKELTSMKKVKHD